MLIKKSSEAQSAAKNARKKTNLLLCCLLCNTLRKLDPSTIVMSNKLTKKDTATIKVEAFAKASGITNRGSDRLSSSTYHRDDDYAEDPVMEYIELEYTHLKSKVDPGRSRKHNGTPRHLNLSAKDSETTTSSISVTISSKDQQRVEAAISWEDEMFVKKALKNVSETEDETLPDSQVEDLETGKSPLDRRDSGLPLHEDPFAPRPGRALKWKSVNMTLSSRRKEPERKILDNVWGEVPRKQVTAIMGPSGAGKTSLLNILSGRVSSRGRMKVDADVRLDNYSVNPRHMKVRKLIAFVAQDDSLQATATPREAIAFSARLRLPRSTTDRDIEKLTKRILTELGLNDCADTIVGGALVKGISGGERKRTSVGVELCCKPDLLFLDEPTSGLDSFSAEQLCQVLKKVANAGASVLFTIHQPASEIFSSFDHLILLNEGRVMYQGSVDNVPSYFENRGHPCPPHYNPADWIMNRAKAVPIHELEKAGFFPIGELQQEDKVLLDSAAKRILFDRDTNAVIDPRPAGIITQIRMMLRRELTNLVRDKIAIAGRLGVGTILSLLVGILFQDVGQSNSAKIGNLQSHFGALVLCCLLCMAGTAQPALLAFPAERPVFVREYSTNHYSVFAYFVSRFIVEALVTAIQVFKICAITYLMVGFKMPFGLYCIVNYALAMSATALSVAFGCAIEDPTLGQELFPLLFIPQLLFSGFFITPSLIPDWIQWARYICALTFGLLILMLEEFKDCGTGFAQTNCNILLENMEADASKVPVYWLVLLALFLGFRFLALAMLRKKASKFF